MNDQERKAIKKRLRQGRAAVQDGNFSHPSLPKLFQDVENMLAEIERVNKKNDRWQSWVEGTR